jgi:hypothetical protein
MQQIYIWQYFYKMDRIIVVDDQLNTYYSFYSWYFKIVNKGARQYHLHLVVLSTPKKLKSQQRFLGDKLKQRKVLTTCTIFLILISQIRLFMGSHSNLWNKLINGVDILSFQCQSGCLFLCLSNGSINSWRSSGTPDDNTIK